MSIRNMLITSVCALSLCGGLRAQGSCNVHMISGVYGTTINGWGTVTGVGFVPLSDIGVMTIDDGKGTIKLAVMFGGQSDTIDVTANFTVAKDCTVTFTATCPAGCSWAGTGFYSKANKEMDLLFTKFGQGTPPITAIAVLKEL